MNVRWRTQCCVDDALNNRFDFTLNRPNPSIPYGRTGRRVELTLDLVLHGCCPQLYASYIFAYLPHRDVAHPDRVCAPFSSNEVVELDHPVLHFGLVRSTQPESTLVRHKLNLKLGRAGRGRFFALLNTREIDPRTYIC